MSNTSRTQATTLTTPSQQSVNGTALYVGSLINEINPEDLIPTDEDDNYRQQLLARLGMDVDIDNLDNVITVGPNGGMVLSTEHDDDINRQRRATSERLMQMTILMENIQASQPTAETVQAEPIPHFYYCQGGVLTIGNGNTIQFHNNGEIDSAGIRILRQLDLRDEHGVPLNMNEKIAMAQECRRRYQANKNIRKLTPEEQQAHLFGKISVGRGKNRRISHNPFATISRQNAFEVSCFDYMNRQDTIANISGLTNTQRTNINRSYFTTALVMDYAYQYGTGKKGVQSETIYKKIIAGTLPHKLYGATADSDSRVKWRELYYQMAKRADVNKGKPITLKSQNENRIVALQAFAKLFSTEIMYAKPHTIAMMKEFMTLIEMQNMRDAFGRELTCSEINACRISAQQLVCNDLFFSPIVQQIPDANGNHPNVNRGAVVRDAILGLKNNTQHCSDLTFQEKIEESVYQEACTLAIKYNTKTRNQHLNRKTLEIERPSARKSGLCQHHYAEYSKPETNADLAADIKAWEESQLTKLAEQSLLPQGNGLLNALSAAEQPKNKVPQQEKTQQPANTSEMDFTTKAYLFFNNLFGR
ncbi:MAG: hypothetical protein E7014_03520 [Alphaproteobacteria bacterium]|nr:hypothetical protein [Alphaproteobacteria bacterium]